MRVFRFVFKWLCMLYRSLLGAPVVRQGALLCTLLLNISSLAHAAPWQAEAGLFDSEFERRMQSRFGSINTARDLETLLQALGQRRPLEQLSAVFVDGVWIVRGTKAEIIREVRLSTISRFLRDPLYNIVRPFIGRIDSLETRAKIQQLLSAYLDRRGYPTSTIRLGIINERGRVLQFKIDEGEPCLIQRIEVGFELPDGIAPEITTGEICDRDEIEEAVNELETDLRERGYNQVRVELADVAVRDSTNTATVFISGVLGQRIRYEIQDTEKIRIIGDIFGDDELTKIDPTFVGPDALVAELERRYRNNGFIDAKVTGPEIDQGERDEFIYRYNVDPGIQYVLSDIRFEGLTQFTDEEALEIMGLSTLWNASPPLNIEEVQRGLESLRATYQSRGYWDARVRDPGTGQQDAESGSVRLTIQVEEGKPRILQNVLITGNEFLQVETIRELLPVSPGEPIDRTALVEFAQDIKEAYVSEGYLYAEIAIDLVPTVTSERIFTSVQVLVNEGDRVKIGDIAITGLVRTDPKVVRRELLIERGDWYSPEKINESRRILTNLGLFRSVQIVPANSNSLSEKETEVDLLVEARESKAGTVTFGPSWSLFRGLQYATEAAYNNIGGVGRQVTMRASISEERHQRAIGPKTLLGRSVGAGFLEPYVFDLPIDGTIAANHRAQAGDNLWELSYGGEIGLTHRLRVIIPDARISTFYGQKITYTEGSQALEEEQVAEDVRIGFIGLRFNYDRRDNLRFPSDGFVLDSEVSWARYPLGGNLRYFRWHVENNYYFGLSDDWVFALGLQATSYEGIQREGDALGILPPSERVQSGGSESIRGFRPRSLGPVVRTPNFDEDGEWGCGYKFETLGGTRRTSVKTELRYKLTDNFATSGFMDSGNVFFTKDQMRNFGQTFANQEAVTSDQCGAAEGRRSVEENVGYDYNELLRNPGYLLSRHYLSYGLALSYLTAIGSVNLAYGLPLQEPTTVKCQNDSAFCEPRGKQDGHWLLRGEFHLNVGARF